MTKAERGMYGENKTERISALVTPTAKQNLMKQAELMGVSLGELLERVGRGQSPSFLDNQQKQLMGESSAS